MPDPGQTVDVKLTGVTYRQRLVAKDGTVLSEVSWLSPTGMPHHLLLPDPISEVVLVAPEFWPPQPGDVWSSGADCFFFYEDSVSGTLNVRNQRGDFLDGRGTLDPSAWLLRHSQGLTLAYRREIGKADA